MQRDVGGRSIGEVECVDADSKGCDRGHPAAAGRLPPKKPARAHETQGVTWTLEPHVCRHCFGRLVSSGALYACTNCGAEAVGDAPDVLCACGTVIRRHGAGAPPVNAGLRCQPNPSPSPEFPSLFVAAEAPT